MSCLFNIEELQSALDIRSESFASRYPNFRYIEVKSIDSFFTKLDVKLTADKINSTFNILYGIRVTENTNLLEGCGNGYNNDYKKIFTFCY